MNYTVKGKYILIETFDRSWSGPDLIIEMFPGLRFDRWYHEQTMTKDFIGVIPQNEIWLWFKANEEL